MEIISYAININFKIKPATIFSYLKADKRRNKSKKN